MKNYVVALMLGLCPVMATGHGGEDPIKELEKNQLRLSSAQKGFDQLESPRERVESLESQANYLLNTVMILRSHMAEEYPHVKEGMTKYKLDYIDVLDESLKDFKITLKQMQEGLPN